MRSVYPWGRFPEVRATVEDGLRTGLAAVLATGLAGTKRCAGALAVTAGAREREDFRTAARAGAFTIRVNAGCGATGMTTNDPGFNSSPVIPFAA